MLRILSLLSLLSLLACEPVNRYFGLEDDNLAENFCEDIIQFETGEQIDLTPSNKDEKFHIYPRK